MDNKTKRLLLFFFGCIASRFLLVWLAYKYVKWVPYMGIAALIIGCGFITIFLMGARKTGPEVFGDRIWWNALRPIHGGLYLLFAIMALTKFYKDAWKVLLLDVCIGLIAFFKN
jgi:hypothetical protein